MANGKSYNKKMISEQILRARESSDHRCHLSNIMPDSIFYDSMAQGMTQVFFSVGVVIAVFLSIEEMDSVLSLQDQWAWGNLKLQRTKADGIDYLSMRFQFWSMSKDSRVGILLRGSSVRVCLVVLNQGCCSSRQYNLLDRMLRLDANTTLNQSYVLFITLVKITYQSGNQYLSSIHSQDSSPWQVLYILLFFFFFFLSPCRCFKLFVVQCLYSSNA